MRSDKSDNENVISAPLLNENVAAFILLIFFGICMGFFFWFSGLAGFAMKASEIFLFHSCDKRTVRRSIRSFDSRKSNNTIIIIETEI